MTTKTPTKPLKILMLHGYTQSGPLFRAKTRALEKNLQKAFPAGIALVYPTAPIKLHRADIPVWDNSSSSSTSTNTPTAKDDDDDPDAWGWWRRKGETEPYVYEGLETGCAKVAEVLVSDGPFDGVIGFSQGGALAGMVASLLEPGRREAFEKAQSDKSVNGMPYPAAFETSTGYMSEAVHAPLKFAVSYSGFAATMEGAYRAFYEPKIQTPMLHFLGSVDTVVEERRSLRLVEACEDGGREGRRVVYHPGGHFLPSSQKQYVGALVGFIREVIGEWEEREKGMVVGKSEVDELKL